MLLNPERAHTCRIWLERPLSPSIPPLPGAGTPFSRPGSCSRPWATCPWTPPGMGHSSSLWCHSHAHLQKTEERISGTWNNPAWDRLEAKAGSAARLVENPAVLAVTHQIKTRRLNDSLKQKIQHPVWVPVQKKASFSTINSKPFFHPAALLLPALCTLTETFTPELHQALGFRPSESVGLISVPLLEFIQLVSWKVNDSFPILSFK